MSLFGKSGPETVELSFEGRSPGFDGANEWLNSEPLAADDLAGHVVLVDFWTYTCINWLRTLPSIRAWAETYREQGLVVVGVHTPEFPFEHDVENVRRLVKELRVDYPVAIDNDYAVWDAFANRYWPALYAVDSEGAIRYHAFRRRSLRGVGTGRPAAAGRGRRARLRRGFRARGTGRLGPPRDAGDVPRLRPR